MTLDSWLQPRWALMRTGEKKHVGGCGNRVVGLSHPWGGPAGASVVSSSTRTAGRDWEGRSSAAGRGRAAQVEGAE